MRGARHSGTHAALSRASRQRGDTGLDHNQHQIDPRLTPDAEKNLMERQCLKQKLYPAD